MTVPDQMFERFYGYTLGRSYRSDPPQACRDAMTMLMIGVGVPATLVGFVLAAAVTPGVTAGKEWVPWATIATGVALFFWVKKYERYAQNPEAVERYRSPQVRRRTLALYLGTLLLSPVVAGLLLRGVALVVRTA